MTRKQVGVTVALAFIFSFMGSLAARCQSATQPVGDALVIIKVPNLGEAEKTGSRLFVEKCASCHGLNGVGKKGSGPPLIHPIYRPGHHADISFWLAAKHGVRSHHWRFGNMPPVEGIKKSEVDSIVNYIRVLQRANGIQ